VRGIRGGCCVYECVWDIAMTGVVCVGECGVVKRKGERGCERNVVSVVR
jgi:hypothetical protein